MSGSHDCDGDAAAYVLGALEAKESATFSTHLEECAVCRDEVDTLRGVVDALPAAATQYRASRQLRSRVMRDVRRESRRESGRESRRESGLTPGPRRGPRRFAPEGRAWLAAAFVTCVVAAAAVVTGVELSSGGGTTVIQARVAGIGGTAQMQVAGGHGELVVRDLTPPGRGHVYEVWLQSGSSAPVPASVLFGVGSGGDAVVGLPTNLHGVSSVLVTPEPLGGSKVPTHTPVIVAHLD